MRPDFAALLSGEKTFAEITASVKHTDLAAITHEYYAEINQIVSAATDVAVVTVPIDPALDDQQAGEGAWTLAHVIAHLTATAEESASLASAMARGAAFPDDLRLRSEVDWQQIRTATELRARLAESERMAVAFLNTWPATPDLARTVNFIPQFGPMNAIGRHLLGLMHAEMHLEQLREIMRQMNAR
jgi:hypothetical protein